VVSNSHLEKEYNLWILLNHTRHAIYRARELELDKDNITVEQARLLYVFDGLKGQGTPTEIAKYLFRESHTISSLIDRMVKKDLVKRVKDPCNKKIVRVMLTPRGQGLLQKTTVIDSIHRIMYGLNNEQLVQLKTCLDILMQRASQQIGSRDNGVLEGAISDKVI
jgi:DNA-binding MarR family transcriptional regulator